MQPLNDNLNTESIIPNITLKYIELKYYFVCQVLLLFRISSGCIYHSPASYINANINKVLNGNDD